MQLESIGHALICAFELTFSVQTVLFSQGHGGPTHRLTQEAHVSVSVDQLVNYLLNGWLLMIDQDPVCMREAG